jgi:hypothetical protein
MFDVPYIHDVPDDGDTPKHVVQWSIIVRKI